MKKTVLLFSLISLAFGSNAQTNFTSVANGDWFNPSTWSPALVPGPNSGTIIINTQVTFNQLLVLGGQPLVQVNASGSLINTSGTDSLVFGNDVLINHGYISCGFFGGENNDSTVNYGSINVNGDFVQSGLTINHATGSICVGQQFTAGDQLRNDGSIKSMNLINGGNITGTGGRFCISNWFINSSSISGVLDFCDATPNTPWDVNAGTITGTITSCANGPCTNCQPNGIHELENTLQIGLAPNPLNQFTVITIENGNSASQNTLKLYDFSGKLVRTETFSGNSYELERRQLPAGIYLLRIETDGATATAKLLAD